MENQESRTKISNGYTIAMISLVLGCISIIPCFFFMGPVAIILGIIGYRTLKRFNQHMGRKYAITGIVLGFLAHLVFIPFFIFFREAQDHGRTSRIHDEMRKSATALETYYTDYNAYPKPDFDAKGRPVLPKILTTPVAYMKELPKDYYDKDLGTYRYGGGNLKGADPHNHWFKDGWLIISNGPDRKPGSDGASIDPFKALSLNYKDFILGIIPLTYDPTNGIGSAGDIWRWGP